MTCDAQDHKVDLQLTKNLYCLHSPCAFFSSTQAKGSQGLQVMMIKHAWQVRACCTTNLRQQKPVELMPMIASMPGHHGRAE